MAITNTRLRYSPTYDVYVHVDTMVIYKRCNRKRKTEITDEELVPAKLRVMYNGYIHIYNYHTKSNVGIYRVYADVFPELVEGSDLHQMDPETYCEIDHKTHEVDTLEANYPSNLRWVSRTINRADTSRRVTMPTDEKHLEKLMRERQRYHEKKKDPEWLKKAREKDAKRKMKKYYERKDAVRATQDALNAQIQKLAKKGGK